MNAPSPTPNAMPGAGPAVPAAAAPPTAAMPASTAPTGGTFTVSGPNGDVTLPHDASAAQINAAMTDSRPPWEKNGQPFDPERAWTLIQNKDADLAALKAKTDPIVTEWEQLRRASQTELDRANEDLGKANTAAETWRTQAIRAKAEALATGRFVDAETVVALIGDLSVYGTDDGIDTTKLTARLDQLAADKPFLVAAAPQPPGFTPNRAQGQAGTGGAMPLDAQIKAAQDRGDYTTSIALKQQHYHQNRS